MACLLKQKNSLINRNLSPAINRKYNVSLISYKRKAYAEII